MTSLIASEKFTWTSAFTSHSRSLSNFPERSKQIDVYTDRIEVITFKDTFNSIDLTYDQQRSSITLTFAQNEKSEYYLVLTGHANSVFEYTLKNKFAFDWLLAADRLNGEGRFLKQHLIGLYNSMVGKPADSMAFNVLNRGNEFPYIMLLAFPLLRHEQPTTDYVRDERLKSLYRNELSNSMSFMNTIPLDSKIYDAMIQTSSLDEFCEYVFTKEELATPEDYALGKKMSPLWALKSFKLNQPLTNQVKYEQFMLELKGQSINLAFTTLFEFATEEERRFIWDVISCQKPGVSRFKFPDEIYSKYFQKMMKTSSTIRGQFCFNSAMRMKELFSDEQKKALVQIVIQCCQKYPKNILLNHAAIINYHIAQWYLDQVQKELFVSVSNTQDDIIDFFKDTLGIVLTNEDKGSLFNRIPGYGNIATPVALEQDFTDESDAFLDALQEMARWGYYSQRSMTMRIIRNKSDRSITDIDSYPFSYDTFMLVLERLVKHIDQKLSKLGVELSPNNRRTYISLDRSIRDRKRTWDLTDQVKDTIKLVAFNCLDESYNVEDMKTYAELPDDLFYEILFDSEIPATVTAFLETRKYNYEYRDLKAKVMM